MEVICIGKPEITDPEYFWQTFRMEIRSFYQDPENVKAFNEWQKNKNKEKIEDKENIEK